MREDIDFKGADRESDFWLITRFRVRLLVVHYSVPGEGGGVSHLSDRSVFKPDLRHANTPRGHAVKDTRVGFFAKRLAEQFTETNNEHSPRRSR